MSDMTYAVREIRFVIEPELTHCYVLCGAPSDGMLGVQGWHHKAFPYYVTALDILTGDIRTQEYLAGDGWGQVPPGIDKATRNELVLAFLKLENALDDYPGGVPPSVRLPALDALKTLRRLTHGDE
jgi:hypothetical protein